MYTTHTAAASVCDWRCHEKVVQAYIKQTRTYIQNISVRQFAHNLLLLTNRTLFFRTDCYHVKLAVHNMTGLPDRFSAGKRQYWREFLKLYQHMPELWDVHHADYRNKELRNESYEILQNKLKEIQPNATKSDVGRRINIFRTNYRREQMRIWKQQELGLHSDLCKPTLWFYDNMSFLLSQESFQHRSKKMPGNPGPRGKSRGFKKNITMTAAETTATLPSSTSTDLNSMSRETPQEFDESLLLSPKIEIFENAPEAMETDRTMPNIEMKADNADTSASDFNEPSCSSSTTLTVVKGPAAQQSAILLSEASEALAKSWAIQYEEMAPTQRILARKAIADILFEGCMGNLRINRGEQTSVGNRV